jgi:hypothetical protein
MKRIMTIAAACLLLGSSGLMAKGDKGQGAPHPNENAYEHANENARFKRDGEPGQHKGRHKGKHKKKKGKHHKNTEEKETHD